MGLNYIPRSAANQDPAASKAKPKQLLAQQRLAKRQLARTHLIDFAVAIADFKFMVDPFHVELCQVLDNFIAAAEQGKHPILIVYAPPRAGKSQLVVRSLIPFILGIHPEWETAVVTYNQELADDHGRDVRGIIMSPAYQELFPLTKVDPNDRSAARFGILHHPGGCKCVGHGGPLTGRGANILVMDDLLKDGEEARSESHTQKVWNWVQGVALTRLDPSISGTILMATRWSEIDPTGRLLDSPIGRKAHVFGYSALDENDQSFSPQRFPTKRLLEIRENLDPKIWSSLYQGCPVSEEGVVFKQPYIQISTTPPPLAELRTYITADPAASSKETSDFWTYVVWGVDYESNLYLLDMYRRRGKEVNGLTYIECLLNDAAKYKPMHIYMERCHSSNVLEPIINKHMRENGKYYSFSYPSPGNKDKVARSAAIAARMQQGKVYIRQGSDNGVIIHELLAFPDGKNDDIVDCFSMMGRVLNETVAAPPPPLPKVQESKEFTWDKAKERVYKPSQHFAARRPRSLFK